MKKSQPKTVCTSAPGKIILFGEHAVNRGKAAIAAAIDKRVYCRIRYGSMCDYTLQSGDKREEGEGKSLAAFKVEVDKLRQSCDYDTIRETARDFFAPARYVLASLYAQFPTPGISIEWISELPIGAGLGSGAATYTSMVHAFYKANDLQADPRTIAETAFQGDIIAHGGIASSLDSSTSAIGGYIRYTEEFGAEVLDAVPDLHLVLGDTLVRADTAELNSHVRKWLSESKSRMHIFENVGYIVNQALLAFEHKDLTAIGNLMDLHEFLQEAMGTSCPECRRLIDLSHGAGALGAKVTGSGGGGIIIILCPPEHRENVMNSIREAGGNALQAQAGAEGVRLEVCEKWNRFSLQNYIEPDGNKNK